MRAGCYWETAEWGPRRKEKKGVHCQSAITETAPTDLHLLSVWQSAIGRSKGHNCGAHRVKTWMNKGFSFCSLFLLSRLWFDRSLNMRDGDKRWLGTASGSSVPLRAVALRVALLHCRFITPCPLELEMNLDSIKVTNWILILPYSITSSARRAFNIQGDI